MIGIVLKNGLKYEIIRIWQRKRNVPPLDFAALRSGTGNFRLKKNPIGDLKDANGVLH
jgi:hypothetical protein